MGMARTKIEAKMQDVVRIVNKGRDRGRGITREEHEQFLRDANLLRATADHLSAKKASGDITPEEERILRKLMRRSDLWSNPRSVVLWGVEDTPDAMREKKRRREEKRKEGNGSASLYTKTANDIPVFTELGDEFLGTFGYGPYGSEEDRLSNIIGDWAQDRAEANGEVAATAVKDAVSNGWEGVKSLVRGGDSTRGIGERIRGWFSSLKKSVRDAVYILGFGTSDENDSWEERELKRKARQEKLRDRLYLIGLGHVHDKDWEEMARKIKMRQDIYVHSHTRRVNGRTVRVKGHRKSVYKNSHK